VSFVENLGEGPQGPQLCFMIGMKLRQFRLSVEVALTGSGVVLIVSRQTTSTAMSCEHRH
jgi:hypothetical protein